jgi:aspartate kinase
MKICKFGGSSLANSSQIKKIIDIVKGDESRKIVVVSAPGKRFSDDIKVTDLLIECAELAMRGNSYDAILDSIVERFAEIEAGLGVSEKISEDIKKDLISRLLADKSHKGKFMDSMKAAGEDSNAKVIAAGMRVAGINAKYLDPKDAGMILSDEFGNAQLLDESYKELAKLADTEEVIVFPGFFGYTKAGEVATFPRGGSDITGSILAAAVNAKEYENFTDVDSVVVVDPRIVSDAVPIYEMTYREMRELSYTGFNILHDEAIVPAVKAGIPIHIKNTNSPSARGTRIVRDRDAQHGKVAAISSSDGFCTIFFSKYLMNREVGFVRKVLQILEEEGLSFEHIPSGIDNMSIILDDETLDDSLASRVMDRIKNELQVDNIYIERGLSVVMIVGEGMRFTIGLSALAAKAFSDANVNVEMINQGSSEISIMYGVKSEDRIKAVKSLYNTFFGDK